MGTLPLLHGVLAAALLGGGCADRNSLTIHLYRATDSKPIGDALIARLNPRRAGTQENIHTDQNGIAHFCAAKYGDLFRINVIGLSFHWQNGKWMIEQKCLEPMSVVGPPNRADIPVRLP